MVVCKIFLMFALNGWAYFACEKKDGKVDVFRKDGKVTEYIGEFEDRMDFMLWMERKVVKNKKRA